MAPPFVYHILSRVVSVVPLCIRRELWWYLACAGMRLWQRDSTAQRIPGGMYVKWGTLVRPAEAEATRFVGTHTSIPVPVIVDSFTVEGVTWIVMSRLPGSNLGDSYDLITPEIEQELSDQLARLLAPLRAIPAPSPAVCGFGGGPIYCERLAMDAPAVGPFENIDVFHHSLLARAGPLRIPDDEDAKVVHETIKMAHERPHRLCLTHNDLAPHNILIDDDWKISGIVDWESCAWMPEYWCVHGWTA